MNLVLVPLSTWFVPASPALYKGGQVLGECVNMKRIGGSPRPGHEWYECRATVKAGTGYADTEGRPFKDYYCAECAATLKGQS